MNSARPWRYFSAIAVDESQQVLADPEKQNYTVVPESAYCSIKLRCERCKEEFWFSKDQEILAAAVNAQPRWPRQIG